MRLLLSFACRTLRRKLWPSSRCCWRWLTMIETFLKKQKNQHDYGSKARKFVFVISIFNKHQLVDWTVNSSQTTVWFQTMKLQYEIIPISNKLFSICENGTSFICCMWAPHISTLMPSSKRIIISDIIPELILMLIIGERFRSRFTFGKRFRRPFVGFVYICGNWNQLYFRVSAQQGLQRTWPWVWSTYQANRM